MLAQYVTLETAQTISGAKTFSNPINANILGNATTADRLSNSRTITIGNTSNTFDGSQNLTWTLANIATAANVVSLLGTTAVNRATADASGNTITSTYLTKASGLTDVTLDTGNSTNNNIEVSLSNNNVYLKLFKTFGNTTTAAEDSKIKIYGSGGTTVTTDSSGDIKITSTTVSGDYLPLTAGEDDPLTGQLWFYHEDSGVTAYLGLRPWEPHISEVDNEIWNPSESISEELYTNATLCAPYIHLWNKDSEDGTGIGGSIYFGDNENCYIKEYQDDALGVWASSVDLYADIFARGDLYTQSIIPHDNVSYNIGSASERYSNIYTLNLNSSGTITSSTAEIDSLIAGNLTVQGTASLTALTTSSTNLVTNLNADMVDGFHVHSTVNNNEANKIVRTDGSGDIRTRYLYSVSGGATAASLTRIYCSQDEYLRYLSPVNFQDAMATKGTHDFAAANYSLSSASWTSGPSLATYSGTFAIQIKDVGTNGTNYYSGMIMVNTNTGRDAVEEIPLNALMATSSDNDIPRRIYAGMQKGILKLSSQDESATDHNITVKILKLISI